MNDVARGYVKAVLAVGLHDPDYVDAYYGPAELKAEVDAERPDLRTLGERVTSLREQVSGQGPAGDEIDELRRQYLLRQLAAVAARIRMLDGERLSFDEESAALYDAVAPGFPETHFEKVLAQLEDRLPPAGPLLARYESYRRAFIIPLDRLDAVFQAAIGACRERTLKHVALPDAERFTVEYVTGKSWSGYNWYRGNYRSLIQVNTDLPIYIDRAIDLACHEGYPGHHVYNALLEKHLVRRLGWIEFSAYALFSPQSLIAEGTANYGIDVAFPGRERLEFERTLFPRAGLDPARAAEYFEVQSLVDRLSYAGNEAAREYIDGRIDAPAAAAWLERFALMSPEQAAQRVRFFDQYRSYVINYNLGRDMVKRYIESRGGTPDRPEARWREFAKLLSSPRLPSGLA